RTGLTVRTLHHYDEIGLLTPSGRSEAGYRLYSQADVARLHGIQSLQQLGLPLAEIGRLLEGAGAGPRELLERQMALLDEQVARAMELRGRLSMLHDGHLGGREPAMDDWLGSLALMETYGRHFKSAELRRILDRWKDIEGEWVPLKARMRAAMDAGHRPDSEEVQPLVNHWMQLVLHWMGGDFELMARWREMFVLEPSAQGFNHAPEGDMIDFVDEAAGLRMALTAKYLTLDDIKGFGRVPRADWHALDAQVSKLLEAGTPPGAPAARAALERWNELTDHLTGHRPEVKEKLLRAWAAEPLLRAGSIISPASREFLEKVRESA
ncbi:MAG: MerR family transcriptional regulator, partial [Burkholderiaceae bacterium]